MTRFALGRLLAAIPTVWVLVTAVFLLMRMAPGGPFDSEAALAPEVKASLEAAYGLDRPLHEQYVNYLAGLLRGNLGPSYTNKDYSVEALIRIGAPVSISLGVPALAFATIFGLISGCAAAVFRDSLLDRALMGFTLLGLVVPALVLAPLMAWVFGVYLDWLPVGGWEEHDIEFKILPIIALTLPIMAFVARLARANMIEILNADYIRTAKAKGVSQPKIVLRHALKPTLVPVVSYLGPAAAAVVTGSVVVETIFGIPGIGRYFVYGAINRDYPLVLGIVLFYSSLIIIFNLLAELLYAWLDPRIRYR